MVEILNRITKFYMEESCGQCSPCREGTGWMHRIVNRFYNFTANLKDLEILDNVACNIAGNTICALGDAAVMPVRSFIKHYREEFLQRIAGLA
jgi:NADH-quinone oxidoreductase subunit F